MRQTSGRRNSPGEKLVKDIKRATRKQYSSEEKIRIVLDGLRGEDSIAELCRREGISQGIYYKYLDLMNANFMESNPIPVKTGLHLMGLISSLNFRSPMCPMSNENLQKFEIILKNYGLLKEIVAR